MRTIAVASQKGGSGKTTLTAALSVIAAAEFDHRVAALDLDPQKSLANWGERREEGYRTGELKGVDPANPLIGAGALSTLQRDLRTTEEEGYTLAFLDTPGVDQAANVRIMAVADVAIVPVQLAFLDLESCLVTAQRLQKMGKPFSFVLNQVSPSGAQKRIDEARAALDAQLGGNAPIFDTMIYQRVAYADAMGTGQGVSEYEPKGKATSGIRDLFRELETLQPVKMEASA